MARFIRPIRVSINSTTRMSGRNMIVTTRTRIGNRTTTRTRVIRPR